VDEHLERLLVFLRSMPGCPSWSRVLVGEDLTAAADFDRLASPGEYASRFSQLLHSRPWLNLHAKGCWRQALVVSVEMARDVRPSVTAASVQLSGPEQRIEDLPGWDLELLPDA
jgi:hypothetical protein